MVSKPFAAIEACLTGRIDDDTNFDAFEELKAARRLVEAALMLNEINTTTNSPKEKRQMWDKAIFEVCNAVRACQPEGNDAQEK